MENAQSFFDRIIEFSKNRLKDNRFSHIADEGLNTYIEIPGVEYASLYLMNDDTFEFNHSKTIPDTMGVDSKKIFPVLVENGLVGDSLHSVFMHYDNEIKVVDNKYFICIPLLGSKGALGLVVLLTQVNPQDYSPDIYKYGTIFAAAFSSALENVTISQKYKKSQELLDQQVAFRTMKLVESQKKLADKFEDLRSNLSMSIPHEVRTPINQILGFSDFLIKYYSTTEIEDAHEMLNDINSSAKRLKELFENYLYYANLSILATNVYDIMNLQQMVTPSIEAVILDTIAFKGETYNRINDVKHEIEDGAIAISEEYLKKVCYEIIDNSFKYSDPGTPIEIKCLKSEDDTISPIGICEIIFKDHGRGMAEDQIKNIDAYMQFDRKLHEQQGSGLGMSIVQRIIDLHNGLFSIDSKQDEYTKVTVKLPLSSKTVDDM